MVGSKAWRRKVNMPLAFVFAATLCCAVLILYLIFPQDYILPTTYEPHGTTDIWTNPNDRTFLEEPMISHTTQPMTSSTAQENFTCSANEGEVIHSLPQAYQDFLRYRHCRAYPTLLTPSPCEDDLYLLLAIKSTPMNVERRTAVRDTWGGPGKILGRRIKLVFLMGRSHDQVLNKKLQPLLEWESRRFGDILQWDFVDVLYNQTLKEVGLLSWVSQKCRNVEFVLKGNDDVFVNTENLIEFLRDHNPENYLFAGQINNNPWPDRNKNSTYFIPFELFANGKQYPSFANGGGYLMSRQTVVDLNEAAKLTNLFPIDEVFVGMCLEKLNISLTHHNGFMPSGLQPDLRPDPCIDRGIIAMHTLNTAEMWVMSVMTKNNSLACKHELELNITNLP